MLSTTFVAYSFILIDMNDKDIISFNEALELTGYSRGYLYRLISRRSIPHYKPNGGRVYFDRDELVAWLKRNRVATAEELEAQAQSYCMKGGAA